MELAVRNVSVGMAGRPPLQSGVSFSVRSGEVCCVLGPNGCGKSTLVKTILGVRPPLAGSITVDGSDVSSWSASQVSEKIAYVAQTQRQSFPFEVEDVVMLGRVARTSSFSGKPSLADRRIAEDAMREMGIYHLRKRPYVDVSGGELQMVMFARALAQKPGLMILDEPPAALDYGNAMRVVGKVREIAAAGYAVVMVTHNPDHAFMTRSNVVLFRKGKPMLFGPAEAVITRENIRDAYGINVKLVEFGRAGGQSMRLCAPEFGGRP